MLGRAFTAAPLAVRPSRWARMGSRRSPTPRGGGSGRDAGVSESGGEPPRDRLYVSAARRGGPPRHAARVVPFGAGE